MKIAVYNCFAGQPLAETGLSRRIAIAAGKLGWQALETASSAEINGFNPDFILALHFFTPKLTEHPTYGCMWSPPAFFEKDQEYVRRVLSYDGFLSSSPQVTAWIENTLRDTPKRYFVAPFFTSCHEVPYQAPSLDHPRLLYAGTNWDRSRHRELFQLLDNEPYMDVYGDRAGWSYLRHSYCGLIPLDGESILKYVREAGAGLCLHKPEHIAAGTPSLRIFEIAASGAVAICQPHPFITKEFGDSVLYLDGDDPATARKGISDHLRWIAAHHDDALALSRRAYEVFANAFTLEKLLLGVQAHHEKLLARRRAEVASVSSARVQVLLRVSDPSLKRAQRALESVARQEGILPDVLVLAGSARIAETLVSAFKGRLHIAALQPEKRSLASSALWSALNTVTADYFAVMDDSDFFYPSHLASLVSLLKKQAGAAIAYSGAIARLEKPARDDAAAMNTVPDVAALGYFESPTPGCLLLGPNGELPNSFVGRRSNLKNLPDDPKLEDGGVAFLLLSMLRDGDLVFSDEATMEYADAARAKHKPQFYRALAARLAKLPSIPGRTTRIGISVAKPSGTRRAGLARRIWRRIKSAVSLD